jgi:hypothetical protein
MPVISTSAHVIPFLQARMSIIYSLVARGSTILAEFTDSSGNFTTITQSILDRIPNKDGALSYAYDRFVSARPLNHPVFTTATDTSSTTSARTA